MNFDLFDSPELLEIQREGFYNFLNQGISQLLAKQFPVKVKSGSYSIELCLNEQTLKAITPESSPRDCILKMKTYSCKLYAQVKIVCRCSVPIGVVGAQLKPKILISGKNRREILTRRRMKNIGFALLRTNLLTSTSRTYKSKICSFTEGCANRRFATERGQVRRFVPVRTRKPNIRFEQAYASLTSTNLSPFSFSLNTLSPPDQTAKLLGTSTCKERRDGIIYQSLPEWVLLGQLPMMTKRGHFIINGSPRVIVHQVVRSPGIYFQKLIKKEDQNFTRFYGDIIPLKGVWVRLQMTKKGRIEAKFKKGKKVQVEFLQKCLQVIEDQTAFSESCFDTNMGALLSTDSKDFALQDQQASLKKSGSVRFLSNAQPQILIANRRFAQEVTGITTNKIEDLYQSYLSPEVTGQKGTGESEKDLCSPYEDYSTFLDKRKTRAISKAEHDAFVHTYDKLYRTTQDKELEDWQGKKSNLTFFKGLNPENAFKRKKCSENLFASFKIPSRYDLGFVGREKINDKFGFSPKKKNKDSVAFQVQLQIGDDSNLLANRRFALETQGDLQENLNRLITSSPSDQSITTNKIEDLYVRDRLSRPVPEGDRLSPSVKVKVKVTGTKGERFAQPEFFSFSPYNCHQLTSIDISSATVWLYKLRKGEKSTDDIDHSQNRRVRTSGELLQTQFENGVDRLKNLLSTKLQEWTPSSSISTHSSIFKLNFKTRYNNSCLFKKYRQSPLAYSRIDKLKAFELRAHKIEGDTLNERLRANTNVGCKSTMFQIEDLKRTTSFSRRTNLRFCSSEGDDQIASTSPLLTNRRLVTPEVRQVSRFALAQPSVKEQNRRFVRDTGGETRLSPEVIEKGERFVLETQKEESAYKISVKEIFSTKPISGALREFFGSNPLSQYMDQTNPLAEITHKRRISSLGIGGVTRESAGMAIRGIHPTHYGRICPIETPEGKNAGLVNSLAFYTKVDRNGFLKTPYYRVIKGQIQLSFGFSFRSAKEESLTGLSIAPSDLQKSSNNILRTRDATLEAVPVRVTDNQLDVFKKENPDKVQLIGVSPHQMISVATSLIPFLEHNDANRALMGSNMQRQAVPLMISERPIVGTGLESIVIVESGHITESHQSGFIGEVTANKIAIERLSSIERKTIDPTCFVFNPRSFFCNQKLFNLSKLLLIEEKHDQQSTNLGFKSTMIQVQVQISDDSNLLANRRFALETQRDLQEDLYQSYLSYLSPEVTGQEVTDQKGTGESEKEKGERFVREASDFTTRKRRKIKNAFNEKSPVKKIKRMCFRDRLAFARTNITNLLTNLGSVSSTNQKFVRRPEVVQIVDLQSRFVRDRLCKCKSPYLSPSDQSPPDEQIFRFVRTTGTTGDTGGETGTCKEICNRRGLVLLGTCNQDLYPIKIKYPRSTQKQERKSHYLLTSERALTTFSRSNQNTCITEKPLIREFDWVQKGDVLSDCSASNNGELAVGKNILVAYIPWEGYNFEDAIVISERLVKEHVYTSLHIERYTFQAQDLKDGNEWFTKYLPGIEDRFVEHLEESGLPKIGSFLKEGMIIVGKIRYLNKKPSSPYERLLCDILGEKNFAARNKSLYVPKGVEARVIYHRVINQFDNEPDNKVRPPMAARTVNIFLGEKRVIQVGDKISGRHGNKGVISTILPRQDMPYLPDGTPIDLILNPLGVPSRMNVGQVLECLLGLAAEYLNQHFKITAFDERYGVEASKSLVFLKLYQARLQSGHSWLFQVSFPGKTRLVDGRSGLCFDQWITVGKAYILKLIHMVSEKIHARSTGPYALITQQPLRGRSNKGGQRLGEMEVWALEGFGAAYTLQELLTKKSDDFFGRKQIVDSILPNPSSSASLKLVDKLKPTLTAHLSRPILGHPEIFKVLLCELQALCLDLGVYIVTPESFKRSFLGVLH